MKMLETVQINPRMFIELYQEKYDIIEDMKKHKFDIKHWEDIKRIPYVDVAEFIEEIETTTNHSVLTFLGCIQDHKEFYTNVQLGSKYVKIPKGTTYGFYDSITGTCSYMSSETIRDMYIEFNDKILKLENDYSYSLDSICGFVGKVWYNSNFTTANQVGIEYNQVYDTAIAMLNSYTDSELKAASVLLERRNDIRRKHYQTDKEFLIENIRSIRWTPLNVRKYGKNKVMLYDIRCLLLRAEAAHEEHLKNVYLTKMNVPLFIII